MKREGVRMMIAGTMVMMDDGDDGDDGGDNDDEKNKQKTLRQKKRSRSLERWECSEGGALLPPAAQIPAAMACIQPRPQAL